ncbi:MAG: amidohydrolase [Lewinellaceae bacterium]|nr:amidohydrolase [Lewinellaceae bacterium]
MNTKTLYCILILLLGCLLFSSLSLAAQGPARPIIDMHQHARFKVWLQDNGEPWPRLCFPKPCESLPAMAKEGEDILRITLEMMEKHNIVKAVVSDENMEEVWRWQASAPEKFLAGGGTFNPYETDTLELRRAFEAGKLQVMGEVGAQYAGVAPNAPILEPYFAMAEEFDVPVLIHCEGIGGGGHNFNLEAGHPLLLQEVLYHHPNLRLYVENAGWPFLEEITALLYRFPNVYADLSTITWIIPEQAFYTYLKGLVDNGLGKRLMYGSDQMEWPEAIGIGIERIRAADFLTEEQKRDIFYNNAARFLRLSKEEMTRHRGG